MTAATATGRVVLVTDAEQRAALAVVRSLGRAGYRIIAAGARPHTLAASSRFCAASLVFPDPLAAPEAFAAAVVAAVRQHAVRVLVPISEAALLAILPIRDQLGDCLVPFPDLATFKRVCDKEEVLRLAGEVGIAIPAQAVLERPGSAPSVAIPPFPLVVKPARSIATGEGSRSKHTVRHVATRDALDAVLASFPPAAYPLMLQQRIVGPGRGVFVLAWDGRPRAEFMHQRLREKPPSGGVSVLRESIAADRALIASAERLLARLGWQGVAMVEFKIDAQTGTPYLMEINGRFWGSLQLAIDAGVDFPRLLVEVAEGGGPSSPPAWTTGIRSRWWWGDVDHVLAMFRRSASALALPPGHAGRWQTLVDFLIPRAANRNETLQLDDPNPFVRETLDWFRGR